MINRNNQYLLLVIITFLCSCSGTNEPIPPENPGTTPETVDPITLVEGVDYFLPNIDLTNWKVTLPVGNPTEVEPPKILDYGNNTLLQEYMYNDSIDGTLVFYTSPDATTANSSYSRTELREQMVPGSNNTNWTFEQGGRLKGELQLVDISEQSSGKPHRTIVMQIHGRLTNEQRDEIGEDDNNAPPVLKIYWNEGRIKVHRKVLKDTNTAYPEILKTSAWTDESTWLGDNVDYDKFTLEIVVNAESMKVILNDSEELVYDDIHVQKWDVFENYFKAGNYLQTTDKEGYCTIKYHSLTLEH